MTATRTPPPAPASAVPGRRRTRLALGWDHVTGEWAPKSPGGRILAAVRAGNFLNASAAHGEVTVDTLATWIRKGREALADAPRELTWPEARGDSDRMIYGDFAARVEKALGDSETELVGVWRRAAVGGDWRAAKELLRHRNKWSDAADDASGGGEDREDIGALVAANPGLAAAAEAYAIEVEKARMALDREATDDDHRIIDISPAT